jgi:hypothetical protein
MTQRIREHLECSKRHLPGAEAVTLSLHEENFDRETREKDKSRVAV